MNIQHLNGGIIKADGTESNLMELLNISVPALTVPNDGRGHTVSAFVVDDKQYALSEVLKKISEIIGGGMKANITGAGTSGSPYKMDHTFAEMKNAEPLTITLNGTPAISVAKTKSSGNVTKITAKFIAFGETMDVTTIEINSSGITGSTAEYTLTENE